MLAFIFSKIKTKYTIDTLNIQGSLLVLTMSSLLEPLVKELISLVNGSTVKSGV